MTRILRGIVRTGEICNLLAEVTNSHLPRSGRRELVAEAKVRRFCPKEFWTHSWFRKGHEIQNDL